MLKKIQNSIVFRIGVMMTLIIALAIFSMLSSYFISDMADSDAAAVNLSGSLRMQSYKMLGDVSGSPLNQKQKERLNESIRFFESRLSNPTLKAEVYKDLNSHIAQQYHKVNLTWNNVIKPGLYTASEKDNEFANTQLKMDDFVAQIDRLVTYYQEEAERKIELLRLIQVIALFCTFILVYFSLTSLRRSVELPLQELTRSAQKITNGDFTTRVQIENKDELGILSDTINRMSSALSEMYGKLEKRVEEKTFELQKSKDSLQFLLNTSRDINSKHHEQLDFEAWLHELSKITQLTSIDLCLTTAEGSSPYIHVVTDLNCNRDHCKPENCATCINGNIIESNTPIISFPLNKDDYNYGVLTCTLENEQHLDTWQRQILSSFSDLVAIALSLKNQADQDRRMALMTERTTIARELHDSLAQALSYLKIQVTRLKRAVTKPDSELLVEEVIEELQQGLNSAYRQLRELLTTFRLQLTGVGLRSALNETVTQIKEQSPEFQIDFNYQVYNVPFTPNEEIHLLQLVREATQNAVHHSQGNEVAINLIEQSDKSISLSVIDNGIGIGDSPEKMNHYGLAIMKERGRSLGGELEIRRAAPKGTCVQFAFKPSYLTETAA